MTKKKEPKPKPILKYHHRWAECSEICPRRKMKIKKHQFCIFCLTHITKMRESAKCVRNFEGDKVKKAKPAFWVKP